MDSKCPIDGSKRDLDLGTKRLIRKAHRPMKTLQIRGRDPFRRPMKLCRLGDHSLTGGRVVIYDNFLGSYLASGGGGLVSRFWLFILRFTFMCLPDFSLSWSDGIASRVVHGQSSVPSCVHPAPLIAKQKRGTRVVKIYLPFSFCNLNPYNLELSLSSVRFFRV